MQLIFLILQAFTGLALVVVTIVYALHTKKMADSMARQMEMDRRNNNFANWENALNDFFIPFKTILENCSSVVFSEENPSLQELFSNHTKMLTLGKIWFYHVFDDEKIKDINGHLTNIRSYIDSISKQPLTKSGKEILLKDYDYLRSLFIVEIRDIKKNLRFESLNGSEENKT